jgi:hypothetical protein
MTVPLLAPLEAGFTGMIGFFEYFFQCTRSSDTAIQVVHSPHLGKALA